LDLILNVLICFSSPWLHSRAINILRNVFSYHDFDPRLGINDEKNNRNRVARLYLPLLNIISNNINKLFDPGSASFGKNKVCYFVFVVFSNKIYFS
jgi:hypothetical protein